MPNSIRDIYDPSALREWIKDSAKDAFKKQLGKIETDRYKLHVQDIDYKDPDKQFTPAEYKSAVMEQRDISTPLVGHFKLIDKETGQTVDEKKTIIAHVPDMTSMGTLIYGGSAYVPITQQRLKSGVYTRIQNNGLLEGQMNPGKGVQMHVTFHPETTVFTIKIGTTNLNLYSIISDMGIGDAEIEKAWGSQIFKTNKALYSTTEIDRLYNIIFAY